MGFYKTYKEQYHFSLNFYALFLLVTFIPDIMGLPPTLINYGFWAIKAATAFWVIIRFRKKIYELQGTEKLFVFIALVYFINIFIDVFWQYFPVGIGNPIDLLGYFLSILIAFAFRYDPAFCSNRSYYFFLKSLGVGLVIAFFLAKESPFPLVGRYDANSTINTINYGQMGCALSLAALYGFLNRPFKYSKLVYSLLFLLGIVSIMKAGSRSPVVVLACVSIFYFFARSGFVKGLIIVSATALLFYFSLGFLVELSEAVGSGIVTRLLSAIETGETSGRDAIYANAIGHFLDSPIFGNFYLIPAGIAKGYYPHNFFIEAFMTTGLVGGLPFTVMVALSVIKAFKLLRQKHPSGWIILLFLQTLIYGMFSSSLYSSQDFWALSLFILSLKPILDQRRNKQIKIEKEYPKGKEVLQMG